MKNLAKQVYDELKKGNIRVASNLIYVKRETTDKFQMTKTAFLNSMGKEIGRLLVKDDQKFELLLELWKMKKRDEKLIVINALGEISRDDYEGTKNFVLSIINDLHDWEICDQLALKVIVNMAIQNKNEIFSLMEKWMKSKNKWVRRLAIAIIPPYIRAKPDDAKICLEFLDNTMQEEERDVKKAVGWALRELSKKDPDSVFKFLIKWIKAGDKNTEWIIKDGMKKLSEDEQDRLKSAIGVKSG